MYSIEITMDCFGHVDGRTDAIRIGVVDAIGRGVVDATGRGVLNNSSILILLIKINL